jgi:hypothetical protein
MLRFRAFLLLALLAVCPVASGQTSAKLTVLPGEGQAVGLVRTTIAGRWYVLGADLTPVRTEAFRLSPEAGGGSIIYWEGQPGSSYTVLFAPDDTAETLAAAVVRLGGQSVVPGPAPPAPPIPAPVPPSPDRVADQVTIITESQDQMTAEQITIVNGQEVRAAAQAAGQTFRAVDRHVTGPDAAAVKHAITAVENQPLPRIVFSKAGQVIAQAALPATVAATVELIRRASGKE